jgi:heme/copper-type cytochrome/quinol oxidase subunit 2
MKRIIPIALAMLFVVALVTVAEACPGCAEAQAGQGANRANIVRGYFWSIVFMMSMPFLIVGSFGTYVYVQYKKQKAAATIADESALTASPSAIDSEPSLTAAP